MQSLYWTSSKIESLALLLLVFWAYWHYYMREKSFICNAMLYQEYYLLFVIDALISQLKHVIYAEPKYC